jgi:hypothetical protein
VTLLAAWVGAVLTLAIFSFLYKDNPFYRFGESVYVGLSLGYYVGITYQQNLRPNLFDKLLGNFSANWLLIVPGLIGIMLYLRYVPKVSFLGRWALAIMIGYYIGVELLQRLHGDVLAQVKDTMVRCDDLSTASIQNLVLAVGVFSVLLYFYFSRPRRGALSVVSKVGIWFVMVCFGASFGYTVMARVSLLIGRLVFLVDGWIKPTLAALSG